MLKLKGGVFIFLFFALLSAGLIVNASDTPSTSTWISTQNLNLTKIADVSSSDIPTTFFNAGNIDCELSDGSHCAVNTIYGNVYNSSLWTSTKWTPIQDFGGNSANYLAIPNSKTGLTSSFGPVFGNYLYFTYDAYGAMTPKYKAGVGGTIINGINNLLLDHYQLTRAPDKRLEDLAGNRLATDLNSLAFSGNSQWMVVTDPNITTLRVNVTNGSVLPFGLPFTYGSGRNPIPKNAITSDGRYAVVAAEDSVSFRIYDLSTCDSVPSTITKSVNCQSRDLINPGFINSKIPGFIGVRYIRFIDDNTISFYANYSQGSSTKYAEYILTTGDTLSSQQYLALGDSYISGEGARTYIEGTDTDNNSCHVSLSSYPYLIGKDLNYNSYHSVACSGATTDDITNTSPLYVGQANKLNGSSRILLDGNNLSTGYLANFMPGYLDQLDFVKKYRPQIVTISAGGNDMGFSDILKICVAPSSSNPTCYNTYEDRLELVNLINNTVFPNLVNTYNKIKNNSPSGTRIYVIGYPQIAKTGGNCAVNVGLNKEEVLLSQQIIQYLDSVVAQAAAKAGVYYVDTQDALNGHRLCETGPGDVAMNGLTVGNDRPTQVGGPIGNESYHPNVLGYQLLEAAILSKTNNLTALMPTPNSSAAPPTTSGLDILNLPHSGRQINTTEYDPGMSADLAYRGTAMGVNIDGSAHLMTSGSSLQAELHSDPIALGSFQTTTGGNLNASVMIPSNAPTGYHTLHFYGQDVNGQPIDIYKYIYVANTADDLDGDGVIDSTQACVGVQASGQDYDKDGIDDACDGAISQPPVQTQSQVNTSTLTSNTQESKSSSISQVSSPPIQSGQGITIVDSTSSDQPTSDSIVQPKVLSATTDKSVAEPSVSLQANPTQNASTTYYALGGAGALAISMLGFVIKRWF